MLDFFRIKATAIFQLTRLTKIEMKQTDLSAKMKIYCKPSRSSRSKKGRFLPGEAGGGDLTNFNTGKLPFIYHFGRKGTPFTYLLLRKGTPFTYLLYNNAAPF